MTTLSDYLRQGGVPADAADAAQAFNDLADHFRPVPSYRVLAWMGEAGRLAKLKGFLALTAAAEDPQTIGLRSAVETVLLAVANPSTEIDMTPASPHRYLLGVLVTVGALSQPDADALVWRGWVDGFTPATAEGVTSIRAQQARADTAASLIGQSRAWEEGQAHKAAVFVTAVEAWRESGEGEPPAFPEGGL